MMKPIRDVVYDVMREPAGISSVPGSPSHFMLVDKDGLNCVRVRGDAFPVILDPSTAADLMERYLAAQVRP